MIRLPLVELRLATLAVGMGIVIFAPAPSAAHPGHDHPPPAARPAEVYGPTVLPDRVILTWSGDPATTQAVTWRTSTEVGKALAEIAVAQAGPGFPRTAKQHIATTSVLETDLATAHYHSVQFTGLTPATKYAYRVGDGVNWSEWFHFTTAGDRPEPFSFIYLAMRRTTFARCGRASSARPTATRQKPAS